MQPFQSLVGVARSRVADMLPSRTGHGASVSALMLGLYRALGAYGRPNLLCGKEGKRGVRPVAMRLAAGRTPLSAVERYGRPGRVASVRIGVIPGSRWLGP